VPRRTPYDEVVVGLGPMLGPRVEALPRRWELLGDVLVLRGVGAAFGAMSSVVAQAYASVLGARLVIEDTGGVRGELREPVMARLWGEGPGETLVVQDGIQYRFDAERIMFSSGNVDERIRMGRLHAAGEVVVDLFAGIGYFALPLLKKAGAARVVACEKNPLSARYLVENAAANGVIDRIEIRAGDCREVAPQGIADRVLLGYFPGGHRFLDVAIRALRYEGGIIHYHDTARADRPRDELLAHLEAATKRAGRAVIDAEARVVKSFAPGVVHAVLDARLGPRLAAAVQKEGVEATA
jgi:tRNA wybutosine-synthesizing protein 2